MDSRTKIAVFASGRGSNAINIIKYIQANCKNLFVSCLVCNVKDAPVIQFVSDLEVPVTLISSAGIDRVEHEEQVLKFLKNRGVDWILLAGYMRVLSEKFLTSFSPTTLTKIVNIHPSLLPKYPGTKAYDEAYANGDKESGVTIHMVDAGVDTGPILLQKTFPRITSDSFDQFKLRGMSLEHELYREFLNYLNKGESKVEQLIDLTLKEKSNEELKSRSLSQEL